MKLKQNSPFRAHSNRWKWSLMNYGFSWDFIIFENCKFSWNFYLKRIILVRESKQPNNFAVVLGRALPCFSGQRSFNEFSDQYSYLSISRGFLIKQSK